MKYIEIEKNKIYKLINNGCLILVSSSDINGNPNLAPIAWQTPVDFDPVTKILIVCDSGHKTTQNIKATNKFLIVIPHKDQKEIVVKCGEVSGRECNKINKFDIKHFFSKTFNYIVPYGCIGYIECELIKEIEEEGVTIFIGRAVYAEVNINAFKNRLLCEKEEGKTLHHLGGNAFTTPSDYII